MRVSTAKEIKQALAEVPDASWAEAVRRERVLRPLARADRHTKAEIANAAAELGLSPPRIYDLLRRFRANPVTSSLLPHKSGPAKGGRRLDPVIETAIERAIDAVFLKRERPTLKRVLMEVGLTCRAGGFIPPSMKALRARVSTRTLRARVKARDGAASAGDRFRQVRPGLRPERPLQVVQIDHTKVDIMLVEDATRACIGRPWLSDPDLRQRSHAGLNKGEASNSLRRAVFFHRQGEIRDRTFENQSFRASGLSLITAAIVHWNTVYLERAVQHLRSQGVSVPDDLLPHVAPLGWEHIALNGDYVWAGTEPASSYRPLNGVRPTFMPRAA